MSELSWKTVPQERGTLVEMPDGQWRYCNYPIQSWAEIDKPVLPGRAYCEAQGMDVWAALALASEQPPHFDKSRRAVRLGHDTAILLDLADDFDCGADEIVTVALHAGYETSTDVLALAQNRMKALREWLAQWLPSMPQDKDGHLASDFAAEHGFEPPVAAKPEAER